MFTIPLGIALVRIVLMIVLRRGITEDIVMANGNPPVSFHWGVPTNGSGN